MKKLIPLFVLFLSPLAMAKIGDCPTIQENGVTYQSHGDYVEAFTGVTETNVSKIDINKVADYLNEMENRKILWHTELLKNDKVENPFLESDVQANITCVKRLEGNELLVSDTRGRKFILDKHTGKLLNASDSKNYKIMFNSSVYPSSGFFTQDGQYYIEKSMNDFRSAGDLALLIKQIDYVNEAMLAIYANKINDKKSYDMSLSLPNQKTYILTDVSKSQVLALVKDFIDNKKINIKAEKKWQDIDSLIKEDTYYPKLEAWYDKRYRNIDYHQFNADMAELKFEADMAEQKKYHTQP